jgi:hypothetical protein
MKVGFSFWGFLAPFENQTYVNTPDGTRGDRIDFVDELVKSKHEVFRLQQQREDVLHPGTTVCSDSFPDVDVVFCEWRWPTWKNSGPNPPEPDYNRQAELLDYYHKKGVPIIIHDGDLKMKSEDELRWPNAILADPCVKPKHQTRRRLSVPWCNNMVRQCSATEGSYNYTYVGNNYERDEQFATYYGRPSEFLRANGIQTMVHGNWLQRSPERKDPSHAVSRNPYISFGPRLSYRDIFSALNNAITVSHITKDEYMPCGNITVRFYEAIMSEVPALIPHEYVHARPIGLDGELIIKDSSDVVEKVKKLFTLSKKERTALVDAQEDALRKIIDPRPATRVALVERIAKGEKQ